MGHVLWHIDESNNAYCQAFGFMKKEEQKKGPSLSPLIHLSKAQGTATELQRHECSTD